MKSLTGFCLASVLLVSSGAAADPVVFNTAELSTSGIFQCRKQPVCSASGSSVMLGSGDSAVTLTFTGVNTLVPLSNETVPVSSLGTISATSSSSTFPTRTNPNIAIVGFTLTLTHSTPVADSASRTLLFGPGGRTTLPFQMGSSYVQLNPGPTPPGYGSVVYTFRVPAIPMNGSANITAEAGVVPEPATLMLVGLGLAGAAVRRRFGFSR